MIFLFLIGVEGTGHHMIRALLAPHIEKEDFIGAGKWHGLLADHWDAEKRLETDDLKSRFLPGDSLRRKLEQIFQDYRNENATHLLETSSFPFNLPHDALRRPDILDFSVLVKGLVEVRYLVLYRNPISAAYSGYRRGFSDNLYVESKIIESNFIYIERQFGQLPESSYRVLHFDDFLTEPSQYTTRLAEWWNLDPVTLESGFENLKIPTAISDIPVKEKRLLEEFFTEQRVNQWESFYMKNRL